VRKTLLDKNRIIKMTSHTSWGIVGTGRIAADFVTALSYLPDARVVAVSSRTLESANQFADRFKIPKRYGSVEELAKDADVQIVYVSSLHPFHFKNALPCIQQGKPVLCEKPFTLNAKEAEQLIQLARERKVLLMEAMWTRFVPSSVKVREMINEGVIGDVTTVNCLFGFINEVTPRLHEPELGGGALLDVGIYPVSFSSWMFGGLAPSKIHAIADLNEKGMDQHLGITLAYKKTQMAVIGCSFCSEYPNELLIIGTKGSIKLHNPFWSTTRVTLTINGKAPEELAFDYQPKKPEHSFNFLNSIGLQYEAKHMQQLLAQGKTESDILSLDETLSIMKTLDEIRRQIGVKYPSE